MFVFGKCIRRPEATFFHDPKAVSHAGAVGSPNRLRLCNQHYVDFARCQIEKFRKSCLVRKSFSRAARNYRWYWHFMFGSNDCEILTTELNDSCRKLRQKAILFLVKHMAARDRINRTRV
jgi:hypothetical protein